MLNFLHNILQQDKGTLLLRFFEAQLANPTKGDWVTNIKIILKSLDIRNTFEEIRNMKIRYFMRIVTKEAKKVAFKYLLSKIKSKGKEINYGSELKCQKYLQPNRVLTWDEQRELFSFRSRMNKLKYNFGGEEICICGLNLENEHLVSCLILINGNPPNISYSDIFNGNIKQHKDIIPILIRNIKKYEEFTLAQDSPRADRYI